MWVCGRYANPMPRLSIDVTPEQHKAIKANALLNDKTLREFALERLLPEVMSDEEFPFIPQERDPKYADWEEELQAIIKQGINSEPVEFRVEDIMEESRRRIAAKNKAA